MSDCAGRTPAAVISRSGGLPRLVTPSSWCKPPPELDSGAALGETNPKTSTKSRDVALVASFVPQLLRVWSVLGPSKTHTGKVRSRYGDENHPWVVRSAKLARSSDEDKGRKT